MKRRILVTGSSRGIGRATALQLARDGFELTLHGRTPSADLSAAVAEVAALGVPVNALSFDSADRAACGQALGADLAARGAYYGIVLSAGLTRDATFAALTGEQWDSVLRTNLDGFYNILQPLVLPMIRLRSGGRIVTVSSVSGVIGQRGQVNYSAAKAGLIGATKALALELASRRITVNCVAPGPVRTQMLDGADIDALLAMIPAGRLGEVEDVASLIAYLCSDAAGYITRQVIGVNGGIA